MDLRRPWPFALFLLLTHALSRFLGVHVHELLGHTAFAFLLGGSAYAVYASPGSGFTYVYLPPELPAAGVVAMQASGIAVEVVLGLLVWWWTRRRASFAWRVFGLMAATVLIVYSLVYMAAGAFDFFPGDTWAIVSVLRNPAMAWGFLALGVAWTLLFGTAISLDVVHLFGPAAADLRHASMMLLAFWLVPAPLAFLPGFSAENLLESIPVAYIAAFSAVLVSAAAVVLLADLWTVPVRPPKGAAPPRDPAPPAWRALAAAMLPLAVLVPLWVGAFGVSPEVAHGVLLDTPPVEVEEAWIGELAVNLEVVVHPGYAVTLHWRFRGLYAPANPLEAQILASYAGRMNNGLYESWARTWVGDAMNESSWDVSSSFISGDPVFTKGQWYPDARTVVLEPLPANGLSFLRQEPGSVTVLTVHDPFKFSPTTPNSGWLDGLVIRWERTPTWPIFAIDWAASGGTASEEFRGPCTPYLGQCLAWLPRNRPEAHETYQVFFRVA